MCRTFFAAMKKHGHGVIINLSGLARERPDANYIAGSTGNAGLNAFTRSLGSKSLNDGIRILAVSPSVCETERLVGLMQTKAEAEYGNPEQWQSYLGDCQLGALRQFARSPKLQPLCRLNVHHICVGLLFLLMVATAQTIDPLPLNEVPTG